MDWDTTNYFFSWFVCAVYGWIVLILLTLGLVLFAYAYEAVKKIAKRKFNDKARQQGLLYNKNVIVTGGSSGIGKCVAIEAAREGAHVTIIARNLQRLAEAREEILSACRDKVAQRIDCLPLDITADYAYVERAFDAHERRHGACDVLVNCAGTAICGKLEDTPPDAFDLLLRLNLTGSFYCIKAALPGMKQARNGKIVLVGSQASLIGVYGLAAYSASKFAVRGLAESLASELAPYNISVTLSLPPDTDTPGFAVEEESKLLETKLISQTAALVQPEEVAKRLLDDALDGKFFSVLGLESFVMKILCAGMAPCRSFLDLLQEVLLMGPLRIVGCYLLYSFKNIVNQCMKQREQQKKSE